MKHKRFAAVVLAAALLLTGCGAAADRLRRRSCSRCPEASQSGVAGAKGAHHRPVEP